MTRVGPIGPLIPPMIWIVDVPTRAEDISKRHHNRIVKEALRNTMARFHAEKIPDRFKQSARQRLDHAPRSERYKRYKRRKFRSTIDLVKTGRTQRWMTRAFKLRVGGTASGNNLKANLILTFPFKGGSGRFKKRTHQAVNIANMILEIQRFANEEPAILAAWFKEEYMKLADEFRSTRKRIRIQG